MADSNALSEINTRNLPEVWDCSDDEDGEVQPHQTPKAEITTASLILLKFMVIFLLTWRVIFRISNMAMDIVFKFTSILHKLSDFAESAKLKLLAEAFPNTMLKAHMLDAINRDNYQQLIVCEKCNFLSTNTVTVSRMQQRAEAMLHAHLSDFQGTLKYACVLFVVLCF